MEAKDWLDQLPPPEPEAEERVWRRFEATRAQQRLRWPRFVLPLMLAAGAAAALAWWVRPVPEEARTVALHSSTASHAWSDTVRFHLDGHGVASGTSRDVHLNWEAGTVRAEVVPESGTAVVVATEEASVQVVGTVFSVRRDALGTTAWVDRGRVEVQCEGDEAVRIGTADGAVTCLPTRPAGLLRRADALSDAGTHPQIVLATLDLGLRAAGDDNLVRGELLARRLRLRGLAGDVDAALADADAYLLTSETTRRIEVLGAAGRIALTHRGCSEARRWLEPLAVEGSAEDQILLAHCLADVDAERARELAATAIASGETIEAGWLEWARAFVGEGI